MQQRTATTRTSADGLAAGWTGGAGFSTTTYQMFFVLGAANYNDLYAKAEAEGAYHYMGAAKAIHAAGFMMLADIYGEMPYTEAISEAVTPKFDDGKTIFEGCLATIDEAIELLRRTQEKGAPSLSEGDSWNGGDIDKWIRMCYGLKARWLNNLSKKAALYNADAILEALAQGPTSNANSTVINHVDIAGDNVGDPLIADPLMTSPVYDWVGMSTATRITKWYVDILTDFDGKGIEDPRANSFIPWAQVGGTNKTWMRSQGVDVQSDIRMKQGPYATVYNNADESITSANGQEVPPKGWYCNAPNADRRGDTVYVSFRTGSIAYDHTEDDQYRAPDGTVMATGTALTRPSSPTLFVTYPEMCFIKAEVLFRKSDKAGAFAAYKEGIGSHIELINSYLEEGSDNPSKAKMSASAINNFLNNAIGTSADLTLAKIMTQKYIALSYNYQNWNDMRRLDYGLAGGVAQGAYYHWAIPYEYFQDANAQKTIPLGKQYRRWRQCAHELNYNSEQVIAGNPHALDDDIYTYPVWWDIAE
jgi:hypothetical protein